MSATSIIVVANHLVILSGLYNTCENTVAEHMTMSETQTVIISFCMEHKLLMRHKPVAFNSSYNVLI